MGALDQNIKVLLNESIVWERYAGQDEYAVESYDPAKTLKCRYEPESLTGGDVQAARSAEEVVFLPSARVYFDANDANTKKFTLRDRFTGPGLGAGQTLQTKSIDVVHGPAGDSWLVAVTL